MSQGSVFPFKSLALFLLLSLSRSVFLSLLKMKVHARPASTRSIRVWNFFFRVPAAGPPRPNIRRIVSIAGDLNAGVRSLRWRRSPVWKTSTVVMCEHVTSASGPLGASSESTHRPASFLLLSLGKMSFFPFSSQVTEVKS